MKRPELIAHNIASADGRLTLAPDVLLLYGDPRWNAVAGSDDDVYAQIMDRFHPQALLEGSGSFALPGQDAGPLPPVEGDTENLFTDFLPEHFFTRPGGTRWFTVVDSRGRVRWAYKEFPGEAWAGWHLLVAVSRATPPAYLAYLRQEGIPYLVAGQQRVDLHALLERMAAGLGVTRIVSTAGGGLNGALLRAGLVDEVCLDLFPALIGGIDTPSLFDSPALATGEMPTRMALLECRAKDDGRVWLHYRVLREDA